MDVDDEFENIKHEVEIGKNSRAEPLVGEVEFDDHEEQLLYTQLYGEATEKPVKSDSSSAFTKGMSEGPGRRGVPSDNKSFSSPRELLVSEATTRQMNSPPGPSSGVRVHQGFVTEEEDKGQELFEECERGLKKARLEECVQGDVEDSDSGSEDDFFVLLDEPSTYTKKNPADRHKDKRDVEDSDSDSENDDFFDLQIDEPSTYTKKNPADRYKDKRSRFILSTGRRIFDVDIDSIEEKPWRRPGVDITDYFNFGFTEDSWRQYSRQLAQLRLESTRKSKILVDESARLKQEYDPDFPPELAAAIQQRQQDSGPGAGLGYALGRSGMIQVELGGGERLPPPAVRGHCFEDYHEVSHHGSEEHPSISVHVKSDTEESEGESDFPQRAISDTGRQFYRPWEVEGPPNMWERENRPTGLELMPNMMGSHSSILMPRHQMDFYGPSFFSYGPGMAKPQPSSNPNFGMPLGVPFQPPSARGAGVVRPLLCSSPWPPEEFPLMTAPYEYSEPTHPRTPFPGLPADWDEELNNGSCSNSNSNEGRNSQEQKDRDSRHDDWYGDEMERRKYNRHGRRGQRDQ